MRPNPIVLRLFCSGMLLWSALVPANEREPTLAAAELVEPALLSGPHHRVQPYARFEGLLAHFVIETDWGVIDAPSIEILGARVAEMSVLEALHGETIAGSVSEAGISSLRDPAAELARIARNPVQSMARAPAGVYRMLTTRARRLGDQARRIGNRFEGAVFHEGSAGGFAELSHRRAPDPWWDGPVDEVGRLLRSEAGHDRARRDLAQALGIASGTGNPLVRARLDQLAWGLASGRLASKQLISALSAGLSSTIAMTDTASRVTAIAEPENRRRTLERRLCESDVNDALCYQLAWRSAFSPELLESLLDELDSCGATHNRHALLDSALLARGEVEARLIVNAVRIVRHEAGAVAHGGRWIAVGQLVALHATDGELLLPLAVDRLSWTPEVQRWFEHLRMTEHARRTVLVAGSISPLAERKLTERGWSIRSHVRWPGSPPYHAALDAA